MAIFSKTSKRTWNNICFMCVWGIITLLSSYNVIARDVSFDFLLNPDKDYYQIIIPLIIGMTAYFIDFAYTIYKKNDDDEVSIKSVRNATIIISCFLFLLVIILSQCSFLEYSTCNDSWLSNDYRMCVRTICVVALFISMMVLKWNSLNSLQLTDRVKRY